jgi:hypothetical protein
VTYPSPRSDNAARSTRRGLLVALAALAAIFVIGVAGARYLGLFRLPIGLIPTQLSVTATFRDYGLVVSGTTTIPDGALLECEVWHDLDASEAGTGAYSVVVLARVASGAYSCEVDVAGWPPGSVTTNVRFRPFLPEQPATVTEKYGADGDRLDGPQLSHDSDGWELDAQTVVRVS